MELGVQYPFSGPGAAGRGRIAGLVTAGSGEQDVTMGDANAAQVAGMNADAELEELCSALPGWHQQQSSHEPSGFFGGLARTVSAPSAFLPSASRSALPSGANCAVEGLVCMPGAPQQEAFASTLPTYDDLPSLQRQPPAVARWVRQGQATVGGSPLRHSHYAAPDDVNDVSGGWTSGLDVSGPAVPLNVRSWPRPPGTWSTLMPPGEQHTSAMLHSLVYPLPLDPNDLNGPATAIQPPPRHPSRAGAHQQPPFIDACTSLRPQHPIRHNHHNHHNHQNHQNHHDPHHNHRDYHLSPNAIGTGLSDWPSGGRMVGGSSGLQLLSGASTASALSGPLPGPFHAARLASSCGEPQAALTSEALLGTGTVNSPAAGPGDAGQGAFRTGAGSVGPVLKTEPLRKRASPGASSLDPDPDPDLDADQEPDWDMHHVGAREGAGGPPGAEVTVEGGAGVGGGLHGERGLELQLELELELGNGGSGGGGTASGGMQSASSGSSMCAAINGALIAAAGCGGDVSGARHSGGGGGGSSSGAHAAAGAAAAAAGFGSSTDGDGVVAMIEGEGKGGGSQAGAGGGGRAAGGGGRTSRAGGSSASTVGRGAAVTAAGEAGDGAGGGGTGLQLLAMRFRNRPGRVPKAVAKLGPIAELAKSAATGKIKLDKEELHDLVTTVETSLARAVTEQKEDSRARNRVAQQRFRNRQRETIAALQAKVEEQEVLILALQEKIHIYEAQAQRPHQQHHHDHPHQLPQAPQRDSGGGGPRGTRAARRPANE